MRVGAPALPGIPRRMLRPQELLHHGPVRGGEIDRCQFGGENPAQRNVFVRMRQRTAVVEQPTDERNHGNDHGAIVVRKRWQRLHEGDGAAEFFLDFAGQGGGGILARLDLAAGEFPFEAEVFVGRPLGDQEAAGTVFDDGANDGNRRRC